jgi:type IV pilus assembly protein PilB
VKLGELLLKESLITQQQLAAALVHQKRNGGKIGKSLVTLGYLGDEQITSLLARRYGVRSVNLDEIEIDPTILKMIPAEVARKHQVLPLSLAGTTLTVAIDDPKNLAALDEVKFRTNCRVAPVVASDAALEKAIERHYGAAPSRVKANDLTMEDMASFGLSEADLAYVDSLPEAGARAAAGQKPEKEIDLGKMTRDVDALPVVKLVNVLLIDSLKRGASDIHIEPYEKEFRVRFRIDGILYNVMALPMKLRDPLTSRIKTMARLDVGEKRLPQDGSIRIRMRIEDRSRELDFRVSCMPTLWGEKVVLQTLDRSRLGLDMATLGFEPETLRTFQRAIARPHGIVLVTGPRRSGKTNTLYASLASLNKPDVSIWTAEDPVEFDVPGLNQVWVREQDLQGGHPLFMQKDPDIVMVGEIQGALMAKSALKTALRGHLVLAGMTANDGLGALEALSEMGIPASSLARGLRLLLTQRLVRRICNECKTEVSSEDDVKAGRRLYEGQGCRSCDRTGYRGRIGLFEALPISAAIGEMISRQAMPSAIHAQAVTEGMATLHVAGIEKVRQGVTTLREVLRETVCRGEHDGN